MSYSLSGFRITPGTNPFTVLKAARPLLEPVRDRLILKAIAEGAGDLVKAADLTGEPAEYPVNTAARELRKETQTEDWRGIGCRLGMAHDEPTGSTYLLVRGNGDYFDALTGLAGLEDYSYWNGTEGPEDIPEDDWDARRDVWDRLLPGWGHIGDNMAVQHLDQDHWAINRFGSPEEYGAVEPYLPSIEDRARRLTTDFVFMDLLKRTPGSDRPSVLMETLDDAIDLAKQEAFDPIRTMIAGLIAPSGPDVFSTGAAVSLLPSNRARVGYRVARIVAGHPTPDPAA